MLHTRLAEAGLAISFLTRLPLGRALEHPPRLADSVWAFPLAGLAVALPGALILLLVPNMLGAILAITACIWISGGLHEDGLADLADGFGGHDRTSRLAIMRDSRIGSFGVLALGLATALRVASLAMLPDAAMALVGAAMLSRAGMGAAMLLPSARSDGLGASAGRPALRQIATGWAGALLITAILAGLPAAIIMAGAGMIAQVLLAHAAQHRLGGQTGDVLGAVQQAGEVAALSALAIFLA